MTLVIDASVAVRWFLPEPLSDRARLILARGETVIAPEIAPIEIMNVAWKRLTRRLITPAQAGEICRRAAMPFSSLTPLRVLRARAAELMLALDHPVYDCLYLALAEAEGCPLVTADDRLAALGAGLKGVRIIRLAEI
jgi:predicted nucleic acid-binding protein